MSKGQICALCRSVVPAAQGSGEISQKIQRDFTENLTKFPIKIRKTLTKYWYNESIIDTRTALGFVGLLTYNNIAQVTANQEENKVILFHYVWVQVSLFSESYGKQPGISRLLTVKKRNGGTWTSHVIFFWLFSHFFRGFIIRNGGKMFRITQLPAILR